jgi:hypothetical protein
VFLGELNFICLIIVAHPRALFAYNSNHTWLHYLIILHLITNIDLHIKCAHTTAGIKFVIL